MDNDLELPTVGSLLAFFRKSAGFTQEELGANVGMAGDSISRFERNVRSLSKHNLQLICNALQLNEADAQSLEDARQQALRAKHLSTPTAAEQPPALPLIPLALIPVPILPISPLPAAPASPAPGWSFRLRWHQVVAAFLLVGVLGTLLISFELPPAQAHLMAMPLEQAAVDGWLIAKAGPAQGMTMLVSINPRTGEQHPLWPDVQELRAPTLTANATGFNSPALAVATHQMAFVTTDLTGQRSIWLGQLRIGTDDWPGFTSPPRPILDLCAGCNDIVTWSPTGRWLIYKAAQGLMAFAPTTGEMLAVTNSAQDAWPACAPDGQWLAYQGAWGGVVVLPAQDCLPRYPHLQHARMVHGITLGWHPAWSLDSQTLAFESDDVPGQLLYEIDTTAVGEGLDLDTSDPVRPIGDGQCNYLTWATRLRHQSVVILLVCHPPSPSADLGTIAIMPDTPKPAWRAVIHGGAVAWDHLCWLPPTTVMGADETLPAPLA